MYTFSEILENPPKLLDGLKALGINSKQKDDLIQLATTVGGVQVERDSGNRVRGDTVFTCSRVGARLTRHLNCTGPSDKMMWFATVIPDPSGSLRWTMRPQMKAAIDSLGWI